MSTERPHVAPLVDASLASLLEGPVGIAVATSGDDLVPDLVRALGCRALADGRVVVILSRAQSEGVIECLDAGRPIAVTFSAPSSHRTVQLKATSARVAPARRADLDAVARYRRIFEAELGRVGYRPAFARALLAAPDEDLVAVTFTPCAAFDQTPGPCAGRALGPEGAP